MICVQTDNISVKKYLLHISMSISMSVCVYIYIYIIKCVYAERREKPKEKGYCISVCPVLVLGPLSLSAYILDDLPWLEHDSKTRKKEQCLNKTERHDVSM